MSLQGKKIILGVTGGIAAYKSVSLLRLLKKAGAEVQVVLTESVPQFVGELTFSTLSQRPVFRGLWNGQWAAHVEIGLWGDLMVVAPATANTLAKFAHGLCDNALTAVYLAAKCPVMVAPAMDLDMMLHPRTQANLRLLQDVGNTVLPTGEGFLASGLHGPGRMLEPEEIYEHIVMALSPKPLAGKKVVITAGPTQEALDPVRYISNHSTGKMGYALAEQARNYGAQVTLISGPSALTPPYGIDTVKVASAEQMLRATETHLAGADVLIMAAAIADYKAAEVAEQKIKKTGETMSLDLVKTHDVLRTLAPHKQPGQFWVGFALETQNERANALGKLERKNLDMIVLNSLNDPGAGFAHETNKITILKKGGGEQAFPLKHKQDVAADILHEVIAGLA